MIIAFAGHSFVNSKEKVKEKIKEQLRNNITDEKSVTCYIGGYGDFDELCAYACRELKKEFTHINVVYVTPYITLSEQSKIKDMMSCGLCDTSLYPPIENVPKKFAILKRNEWMMTNADLIISYINRSYGGTYRSLQVAKRKKKIIINLCDFI